MLKISRPELSSCRIARFTRISSQRYACFQLCRSWLRWSFVRKTKGEGWPRDDKGVFCSVHLRHQSSSAFGTGSKSRRPTFLLCLRRFIGRRGLPKLIVSGNVETFQASEKTLVSLFELEDVQKHLSTKGIRWQFNLAKAPWWVDFWVLGETSEILSEENTRKIEAFIWWTRNYSCRSWSSSEFKTSILTMLIEEPLTPSLLIIGWRLLTLPVGPLQIGTLETI